MTYRVVQPYGARRDEWTVQSEHGTIEAALSAVDALRAKMTKTGASADAIELIVVNQFGVKLMRRSAQ